jgi:hypothetical protein
MRPKFGQAIKQIHATDNIPYPAAKSAQSMSLLVLRSNNKKAANLIYKHAGDSGCPQGNSTTR